MPKTITPQFQQIRSWLNEIHREKQAAVKVAKAHSERGGYMGETTHPVKDVDDHLEEAHTGSRASENEKDVKEMEPTGNVNETSDSAPKQDDLSYNIGTQQSATGEDSSVEDDYKNRPSDPGTSQPADTSIGAKYSSWVKKEASELADLANEILADIATGAGLEGAFGGKTASAVTPATKTAATARPTTDKEAVQAGYELAALMGLNKEATDATVENIVAETIKQAQINAQQVGAYVVSFAKESENLYKTAAGEMPPEATPDPASEAGGGGPAPTDMPPSPMPEPTEGGGPGGPGGLEGGGGQHEQALQELAMALMELGVSPEELMQLAQSGGGAGGPGGGAGGPPMGGPGGGAGGPPMGGPGMGGDEGGAPMMPPPTGSPAETGAKIASAVSSFKRSGRFKFTEAKTAAQQQQRNEMKRYILEIMGATR